MSQSGWFISVDGVISIHRAGVPRTHLDLKEAGSVVRPGGTSEVESPLGSSTLHSENREDVYILYEEDEEEEEGGEEEGRGAVADERESSGLLNPSFLRRKLTVTGLCAT